MPTVNQELTIALSKGRVFEQSLPLLASAGIVPTTNPDETRKLILPTNVAAVSLMVLRSQDVPTFVEYGGADLGVVGKDVLMESDASNLYEPLDLEIAKCRLSVACRLGHEAEVSRPRVATKYVNLSRRYYAERGVQADVIKLYGSMELAPITGLADRIIDLVDTGSTLQANGLVELECIAEISSRLVVNRASMKMKHRAVGEIIDCLSAALAKR